MTRKARSRLFLASALSLSTLAFLTFFSFHSHSAGQTNKPVVENFHFLIAAPYWSIEEGFVSTIEMKNYHVDQPLTVTPVLYPLHGPEIILDPVTLNPSETRLLNINDTLASYHKHFTVGAAELRYSQLTEGVFGANLTVLNATKSLIYNFQFRLPEMSARLEGLFWFYDKQTDGFVAVQNTSDHDVVVAPTLFARERPYQLTQINLRPHQMELIELRSELHKLQLDDIDTGGIKLESSEDEVIVAGGGLANPAVGFSAPLRMDDPEMQAMRAKQLGQPIRNLPTYDTVVAGNQNSCDLDLHGTPPGNGTDADGIWIHDYSHCTSFCVNQTCTTGATQSYFANGWQFDLSVTYQCNGITVNGH